MKLLLQSLLLVIAFYDALAFASTSVATQRSRRTRAQPPLYYKPYEPIQNSTISATTTTIPKKNLLGFFYDVEPHWEGSSYSYVRPGHDNLRLARHHQAFEFSFAGCVEMEQRPERVGSDGKTTTGLALWSSALALSSFLDARGNDWGKDTNLTCLELGAGLGLPSIVLARHGVEAMATDRDPETLELLERNARANLDANAALAIGALDWSHPEDSALFRDGASSPFAAPDLVLASDVVYKGTRPHWRGFLEVLDRLRENRRRRQKGNTTTATTSLPTSTSSTDPLVLVGYTQRRLDMTREEEGEFLALVRCYGMRVTPLPPHLAPYSDHWPLTVLWKLEWERSRVE